MNGPDWDDNQVANEAIRLIEQDQKEAARLEQEIRDRQRIAQIAHEQLLLYHGRHRAKQQFDLDQNRASTDRQQRRLVGGRAFLYEPIEQLAPVWGTTETPIWAHGEPLMIFGPPGLGKSTLSHLLLWGRLGIIKEVLGMSVCDDQKKVLYIAADRPRQIQRAMRRLVQHWPQEQIAEQLDRLLVYSGPLPVDICTHRDWLADYAQHHNAGTIFIDSVKDACPKPSDEELANGYNLARQEAVARDIEWVENHHNRKNSADNRTPNTLDDVYGSRWLTAGAGSVLCLWGDAGSPVLKLTQLKSPGGFLPPYDVIVNHRTGMMTADRSYGLEELIEQSGRQGITVADAAARMKGSRDLSKRDLESARGKLKRLVQAGLCEESHTNRDNLARYRMVIKETGISPGIRYEQQSISDDE